MQRFHTEESRIDLVGTFLNSDHNAHENLIDPGKISGASHDCGDETDLKIENKCSNEEYLCFELLSDDSIICIMEFISSPSILFRFAQTSKRMWNLVHDGTQHMDTSENTIAGQAKTKHTSFSHLENLMRVIYLRKFHLGSYFHLCWSWREEWERIFTFKKAMKALKILPCIRLTKPQMKDAMQMRSRVGILTRAEENSSIGYDDGSRSSPEIISLGYFSMTLFSYDPIFPSLQAVAISGDFCGVRIFPSLSCLLYTPNTFPKKGTRKKKEKSCYFSVGEKKSQVMVILPNPLSHSTSNQQKQKPPPCFFLGFADGSVMAVFAFTDQNFTTTYTTTCTTIGSQHTDEVTTLCFLPNSLISKTNERIHGHSESRLLASGGVDGNVLIYPNAVSYGVLSNPIRALGNEQVGFLSMDSCKDFSFNSDLVLFTGDLEGKVTVWKSPGGLWLNRNGHAKGRSDNFRRKDEEEALEKIPSVSSSTNLDQNSNILEFTILPFVSTYTHSCSSSSATYTVNVTKVVFAMGKYLITGHTNGELRFWKYNYEKFALQLLHQDSKAHSGSVESIKLSGEIGFTSGGGLDGIKAWNVTNGEYLGKIRDYSVVDGKYSAVVDFLMCRNSIVWLKRCGIIQEWNYYNHAKQHFNPNSICVKDRTCPNIDNAIVIQGKLTKRKRRKQSENKNCASAPKKTVQKEVPWTCRSCQFFNRSENVCCEICLKPKPRKTAEKASAIIHRSLAVDADLESDQSIKKWECRNCFFRNQEIDTICKGCGAKANTRMRLIAEREDTQEKKVKRKKRRTRRIKSFEMKKEELEDTGSVSTDNARSDAIHENEGINQEKLPLENINRYVVTPDDNESDNECITKMVKKMLKLPIIQTHKDNASNDTMSQESNEQSSASSVFEDSDDECITKMVRKKIKKTNKTLQRDDRCISSKIQVLDADIQEKDSKEIGPSHGHETISMARWGTIDRANNNVTLNSTRTKTPTCDENYLLSSPERSLSESISREIWKCGQCTYHNQYRDFACIMCCSSKPSSRRKITKVPT